MKQWLVKARNLILSWEFWVSLAIILGSAFGVIIGQLRRSGVTWAELRFVLFGNLPTITFPTIILTVHSQEYDYTLLLMMIMLFTNAVVVYAVIRSMRD